MSENSERGSGKALLAVFAVVVLLVVAVAYATSGRHAAAPSDVPQPASDAQAFEAGSDGDLGSLTGPSFNVPYTFSKGISLGNNTLTFTVGGTIAAGANQASWRNTTGRTVYVDYTEMIPSGTASTTFIFYVGTSTASTISDFTAPFASLIDGKRIATSSAPIVVNSAKDGGTNGRITIPVANGVYVNFAVLQGYLQNSCSGSVCESATSTNRGFSTIQWFLDAHYRP